MISVTPETKNVVSLTLEAKPNLTWDQATMDWDDALGTWNSPGTPVVLESKNVVSLTLETK